LCIIKEWQIKTDLEPNSLYIITPAKENKAHRWHLSIYPYFEKEILEDSVYANCKKDERCIYK
jgi:hypothetical protein